MGCCELLHLLEVTCRTSLRVDIEVVDLDLNCIKGSAIRALSTPKGFFYHSIQLRIV